MANTTNFGWETPDDTDLVKDGAAAMRTLGNAIDTSLVDLKGGTTGQVLSKNTNTDMDFTWVTPQIGDITEVVAGTGLSGGGTTGSVTLTNTVATAYDAKGDLVAGTGADTFAKRTVGANETRLVADSAETTGLKWVADTTNYAIAAKGDLLVGTAADTLSGLTLGTNNQVLTVDTSTATGVKWATPTSGALVKISSTTFSNVATQDFDNVFSTTYETYLIVLDDLRAATPADDLQIQYRYGGSTQAAAFYGAATEANNSGTTTVTGSSNAAQLTMSLSIATSASSGFSSGGFFYGYQFGKTNTRPNIVGQFYSWNNGAISMFAGSCDTARTYDGFRLKSSSSNISGTVTIYGLEK